MGKFTMPPKKDPVPAIFFGGIVDFFPTAENGHELVLALAGDSFPNNVQVYQTRTKM